MWVWVIAAPGNVNVVGRGIAVLRTDDESKGPRSWRERNHSS